MIKVKAIEDMSGIGVAEGEIGKVTKTIIERESKKELKEVKFKNGGYGLFGAAAFNKLLKIIK